MRKVGKQSFILFALLSEAGALDVVEAGQVLREQILSVGQCRVSNRIIATVTLRSHPIHKHTKVVPKDGRVMNVM